MSLDTADIAATTMASQSGMGNQFWPIIFTPNGLALNTPVEINIQPCDAIWLPANYDKNYGVNAAQSFGGVGVQNGLVIPSIYGINVPDCFNLTGVNPNSRATRAAILGVRFNTPNNPWMMWTISHLLGTIQGGVTPFPYYHIGIAGGMRSISGPISRMWVQIYQYATLNGLTETTGNPGSFEFSRTVFMSSLGFSQMTTENVGCSYDPDNITTPAGAVPPPVGQHALFSGGYQMPQLNTLEREVLKGVHITRAK